MRHRALPTDLLRRPPAVERQGMTAGHGAPIVYSSDLLDGLVTLAATFVTFLAFDDITTDNATSFRFEYTALVACAVWAIVLIVRLARRGRGRLAVACTGLLLALSWGQQKIGPGTSASWQLEYVAATAAFLGFLIVALYLLATGAKPVRTPAR